MIDGMKWFQFSLFGYTVKVYSYFHSKFRICCGKELGDLGWIGYEIGKREVK